MRVSGAAVATVAAAGLLVSAPAVHASAETSINQVKCGRVFLRVFWHPDGQTEDTGIGCFANAGTKVISCFEGCWLDHFWTGNNKVQFKSDGRWQPAKPVGKWTHYDFPNHPGGVSFDAIRIVGIKH